MFSRILKYLSGKAPQEYKIAKHTIFRDQYIADQLYENGYHIVDFLQENERSLLMDAFEKNYVDKEKEGGAFFGVISKTLQDSIDEVIKGRMDAWFKDYMNVNAFVVKTPGKSSQVPLHQDVAAIDEEKYSSINVWMALEQVNSVNGAMRIVPRSHHIFFPYRCAGLDPYTKNIERLLAPYFIPVYLEAGQALIFDSRIFHYSPPNMSSEKRIIPNCRLFPKEAKMLSYYKDRENKDAKIEVWQCADDYLVYKNSYDENQRPPDAKLLGYKRVNSDPITVEEFEKRRIKLGILPQSGDNSERNSYVEALEQQFSVGYDHP